jgi:hypothetical protein
METVKDPEAIHRGRLGAAVRWKDHIPEQASLRNLTDEQKRLVVALLTAARADPPEAQAAK